jgi:hypothetical protein
MKLINVTAVSFACLELVGCIPADINGTIVPQVTTQTESKTPVNSTLTAEVGEKVYESGSVMKAQTMAATTSAPASGHMYGLHFINAHAGFTGDLMTRSFDGANVMCVDAPPISVTPFNLHESYKCLVDANKDKAFEASMYSNHQPYWPLNSKVPYTTKVTGTPKDIDTTGSFMYQLLYQGYAQGVLKFSYREYKDDMARPAFTQDLTYEYKPGESSIIGFKGLRMRVIDANNTKITYVIDQDLNNSYME